MKFKYQARTKSGEIQTGQVEAFNREAAFNVLKSHELRIVALEELSIPFYAKNLKIFQKTNRKDIVLFSRQLAIMFKSDVPIVESLKAIAQQTRKGDLKEKILEVAQKVEGGTSLSEAFSLYPKIFTSFYVNMVKSGEASGKLASIFVYLADYLEKESNFEGKLKGAMVYPAFVSSVFLIVVSIIITYIIPQLSTVLKASGVKLPLITRIVIGVSDFTRSHALTIIVLFALLITIIVFFAKSKTGKKFFGNIFLKIPLIGPFLKKLYLSRFALNLSTLVSGGVPITQALEMTAELISNDNYQKIILKTRDGVKRGETISSVLVDYPHLISPLFFQMVAVGEKTGRLDTSLKNVVSFYQRDVDQGLDSFVNLLEPISIILLGGAVGGLMAAVLLPLYSGVF